jgi:hypothetical protein
VVEITYGGGGSSRTPVPYTGLTFEATDAVGIDNTECSLDGQAFASYSSPVVYDRLIRGTHEVTVRATDEAGNTGEDQLGGPLAHHRHHQILAAVGTGK